MAKRVVRKARKRPATASRRSRKVAYSTPEPVAREVDRRSGESGRGKSRLVGDALVFHFAAQDRRALAHVYSEAGRDREFQADNEAVDKDFAVLDRETAAAVRRPR